tara:strand:+ start:124 stop:483 length:360 start_codon:yes stop_codon:yes gene_type:complete
MAFRLGQRSNSTSSFGKAKIVTTPLEKGTLAEARNDGTIAISPEVDQTNKKLMDRLLKHEGKHMEDLQNGKQAYGENWLMWEDKIYLRKNGVVHGPNGAWPEGHPNHPWEQEAYAAEEE